MLADGLNFTTKDTKITKKQMPDELDLNFAAFVLFVVCFRCG